MAKYFLDIEKIIKSRGSVTLQINIKLEGRGMVYTKNKTIFVSVCLIVMKYRIAVFPLRAGARKVGRVMIWYRGERIRRLWRIPAPSTSLYCDWTYTTLTSVWSAIATKWQQINFTSVYEYLSNAASPRVLSCLPSWMEQLPVVTCSPSVDW